MILVEISHLKFPMVKVYERRCVVSVYFTDFLLAAYPAPVANSHAQKGFLVNLSEVNVLKSRARSRLTRPGTTHSWDLSGRGTTRAEDAQGTPTESYITKYTSIRNPKPNVFRRQQRHAGPHLPRQRPSPERLILLFNLFIDLR